LGPKLSREEDEVVERDEMRAVSSTGVQQPGGEVKGIWLLTRSKRW
jgi:hypothetical protein